MDDQVDQAETAASASPIPANADNIVVSVCTTCRPAGDDAAIGQSLLDATRAAVGTDATVRAVQCLGVCKRPGTVAVTAPDRYAFIFGDLQGEAGAAAVAAFVKSYAKAHFGLVPWRERAESIRKGLVARIPPAIWSPVDGSPPK
jgi:predicted metal-binding protein